MSADLLSSWNRLCLAAEIKGGNEGEKIIRCYRDNGLAYHNLNHLGDCLEKFRDRKNEAQDPIAIELAIWFHDAIYDPRASDNEEKSAQMAADFLAETKWSQSVPDLILATKHREEPPTHDGKLLCDIDLSILGSDEEIYTEYAQAIRSEYSWVEEEAYRNGRSVVLEGFLKRPFIFALPASRQIYEKRARFNISLELKSLNQAD